MESITTIISDQNKYLLAAINVLLMQEELSEFVDISPSISFRNHAINEIEVTLTYYIYTKHSGQSEICKVKAKVEPTYYEKNSNTIIKDLNDELYLEILKHTDFTR